MAHGPESKRRLLACNGGVLIRVLLVQLAEVVIRLLECSARGIAAASALLGSVEVDNLACLEVPLR
ncbi:hypothetical protein L2218_15725, partial [Xanthomonas perforans]|uniref:hypothetical protein n=1 Tax=Xanthomonas perforans TaxID=442694 RepID=UPI001F34F0E8